MTGSPYGVTPGGSWQSPAGPLPPTFAPAPRQSRTPVIISLLVAVAAVAIAVGSWFRPTDDGPPPPTEPTPLYSKQDIADATAAMCQSYQKVLDSISEAGGQTSDDPNVKFTLAVNTRLAIHANSSYLRQTLADHPAVPTNVASIFVDMASAYDEILMAQLAGAPADSFGEMNARLDSTDAEASEVCG